MVGIRYVTRRAVQRNVPEFANVVLPGGETLGSVSVPRASALIRSAGVGDPSMGYQELVEVYLQTHHALTGERKTENEKSST